MKRVAILVVFVVACGGKEATPPPDQPRPPPTTANVPTAPPLKLDSPEALAKTFLVALASADFAKVRALYMTPEHIAALVTCENDPVAELREHLVELEKQLKPTTSKIEFEGWTENGRSVLPAGTTRDGCTAKRDFELATGSLHFIVVSNKSTEPGSKIIAVVKVDDSWRVWRMSKL